VDEEVARLKGESNGPFRVQQIDNNRFPPEVLWFRHEIVDYTTKEGL